MRLNFMGNYRPLIDGIKKILQVSNFLNLVSYLVDSLCSYVKLLQVLESLMPVSSCHSRKKLLFHTHDLRHIKELVRRRLCCCPVYELSQ